MAGKIAENQWTKDTNVEIVGVVKLTGDREVRGIWLDEKNLPVVNLDNNLLTVGEGGINFNYSDKRLSVLSGRLTASGSMLGIRATTAGASWLNKDGGPVRLHSIINAEIQDHKDHKVGLWLHGKNPEKVFGFVILGGETANTFTGDVVIEGKRNTLYLRKKHGVTAIRSDIYIKNGGGLLNSASDQISDSSKVTFTGSSGTYAFVGLSEGVREKLHALVVESKTGLFDFGYDSQGAEEGKRFLILDDLIINDGSSLRIRRWREGRDHFLVRKDSEHLADAMTKISIDGWAKNQVYLKDYDKDYWSIEAAPEPATYGAILGAVGLGIAGYRLRRRRGR